jgi:hypothetical protein
MTSLSFHSNFEPDSNVTEDNNLHSEKHLSPNTLTDAGKMISINLVIWNASASIRRDSRCLSMIGKLILREIGKSFGETR